MPVIPNTGQLFFLGNYPLLDVGNDGGAAELRDLLIGGRIDSPSQVVDNYVLNDADLAGTIRPSTNLNNAADTITIGGTESVIETITMVDVAGELLVDESTTITRTGRIIAMQLANGNVYLTDRGNVLADNLPFESIEVTGTYSFDYNLPVAEFQGPAGFFYSQGTTVNCFAGGTLIRTDGGDVPVEDLQIGDLIWTADRGFRPIRWIGVRHVSEEMQIANPRLKPVKIKARALGNGVPQRDLFVSRQHRIAVAVNAVAHQEVLVPAIKLADLPGIDEVARAQEVSYYHICFDRHEVVLAEGARTESLFLGPQALKAMDDDTREELATLFPEALCEGFAPRPARPIVEREKDIAVLREAVAAH